MEQFWGWWWGHVCVEGVAHIGICGQAWINKANKGRYVWLIYITDGAGYLNPCQRLNSIGKGGHVNWCGRKRYGWRDSPRTTYEISLIK